MKYNLLIFFTIFMLIRFISNEVFNLLFFIIEVISCLLVGSMNIELFIFGISIGFIIFDF